MPPKSKKAREDRLAKQRLCQRRRYAEINNDPELLAVEKEKRRQKYLKKKAENNTGKSPRAIKEQRKRWKENSKRYRQRKKEEKQPNFEATQVKAVTSDESASTSSVITLVNNEDPLKVNDAADRQTIKKVRYEELKKRKRLFRVILCYKKKNKALAKKIQRLQKLLTISRQKNKTNSLSTQSNVALDSELSTCTVTVNNRNRFETSFESSKSSVIDTIKKFYLQDANSVQCAGKKQYITKNKIQMQKRYLCLPLKDLHQKFLNETKISVSYSFFCKLLPFWVTFPKESNRDTCGCQIHENMKLLIEALHRTSIIREKNYDQVLSTLCCDSRNLNCLQRTCDVCKSNRLEYNVDSENSLCTFYQWKKVTKEINLSNRKKKKQILTVNKENTLSIKDAIIKLEEDLKKFLIHTFKIISQYTVMKNLKENLNIHEACVHIDFSENYSLKYGVEVQAFHFGASRQQVSLHTAVIYTHSFITGKVTPKSMCTISECLRHDAPAVWAHLIPLIKEVINLNPFIDTLHFLSDSPTSQPTSQYRNKYIFYLITKLCEDFPQLIKVTWNYSESGHGKGAPDGVGATLKRTADRMVTFGKNIGTFEQFYDLFKGYIENENFNIIVKKIDTQDILFRDNLIPKTLKPFRGTFSVYQVLWEKTTSKTVLRNMSCFECEASEICIHGKHIGFIEKVIGLQEENAPSLELIDTSKKKRIVVLSDITFKECNLPLPSTSSQLKF